MKISVIGAGVQGSGCAFVAANTAEVSEVVSADINLKMAKQAAEKSKSDMASAERVDAGNVDDLLRVIKGSDTVINAILPRFNLNIMNAALKSGANYVDLASDVPAKVWVTKQLALDGKFKDAGLTAVVFTGGPFTTNAAVRYVSDRLDRVEEIRLKLGGTWGEKEEFIPTWSPGWCPEIALTEWLYPQVYENGKWKDVPQFSGVETYAFPEPVGPVTLCHVDYEPVQTLPRFIGKGVKYVEMKQLPDRMAGSFIKMGFASDKPIDVKGVKVAPRDVLLALTPPAVETRAKMEKKRLRSGERAVGCSLAEVKGEKNGQKIIHLVYRIFNAKEDLEKFGTTAGGVAVPAVTTAVMLAKGEVKTKGVIPPEGLEPEPFLAKLAKKGFTFKETITKEVRP